MAMGMGTGIGVTPEQGELAEAVRGWAARAVPPEEVRKLLDAGPARRGRPAYWDGLAAMGLLGPHLPAECGGGDGELLDLAVVLEETGRAALPGPYLPSVLASEVLRRGGATGLVRALAAGDRIGAVALGTGTLRAAPSADGYVLDGTAPPVLGGGDADLILLAADVAAEGGPGEAVKAVDVAGVAEAEGGPAEAPPRTLWLAVDADTLSVQVPSATDPTRPAARVTAEGVTVPSARVLDVDSALVRDLAATLFAAEACGTAEWALRTAAAHAAVREQFGRPIGQFQAVKHLCADMLVRVEQARALAWDAARAADADPATRGLVAALAAATALDAAFTCAKDCIQVLGGIGFTWEHDAHLYLRRATVARQLLGSGGGHRLRAARYGAGGARRELRMDLPVERSREAARYREQAREVIAKVRGLDPGAVRRELAPTGYAAPHLPAPYGLAAGPVQQLAVQQEMRDAGVRISDLGIATWVVPSLITYGTPEQQERHLLPTLRGDRSWCQLFSEPEAGSDLAALRTRAERVPDGWRVDGQKVWTSAAQWAGYGILLARTDPAAPKHQGLTFFLVDMSTPGIEVRPLREITGDALFSQVYFDGVLLPPDAVVGEVGDGWQVARHTLGNERVHMADQVTFSTGLEALIERSAALDGAVRERVGALAAEAHALACIRLRTTLQQVAGREPGAGASIRKLVQTAHQQKVAELALELLGPEGATAEGEAERALHGFLMSRCLTIAGGTTQVQLNVVAERLLGLPRDPEPRPMV
ncbi:acyl-CoA dehydrogenase [Streptomyces sp. NPDC052496]|uniref:acyl-CoA dehydrogenase n=1 Tax=Streptomyces sp. NPDC052496 TaxID=3154951 RepID=UPI00343EB20B